MTDTAPSDDTRQAREFGRWLFSQTCTFVIGAVKLDDLPDSEITEIAFAGRSNVGKSSLINALTNHKDLARTSNTPGRTQQLNFFELGGKLMIADLPGYGYARAPRETVRQWTDLVGDYLQGRPQLRRTCLLIDGRHGIKDSDREVMKMLDDAAVSYLVTLTKCDKVNQAEMEKRISDVAEELKSHVAAHPDLIVTSSVRGDGIESLRAALAALVSER
ncbi:MAG: YihA family ribosome biogenesis GTP-binding protein [Rhodospirillaceae bacterium]|nr:YihA family ribosome biogenesis GTP-binding protein [Rhodospirillaceae bacterium]MBL6940806.1 YihA family ribosome biogenesis GTP-binding protein [Rhodospirillales bacterium]